MKIRKFNEDIQDIESNRLTEIIEEINNFINNLTNTRGDIDTMLKDISKYKSDSKKANDQIDDSIIGLQGSNGLLDETVIKLNEVSNLLKDYSDGGRKFLY